MDATTPSVPKLQAQTKDAEPRNNIPVICNPSRPEDGKKPQGIHLNPKFFKTPPQPRGSLPPCQSRFDHDFRMRFAGNPGPYRHDLYPRGFPPPYPRFRPNFSPFRGPGHPFPQNRFPPPNPFDWHGPRVPNYPHHHPMEPPFQQNFPPNHHADYNFHRLQHPPPPEFPYRFPLDPPPNYQRMDNIEPAAGPSYYDERHDNFYEDARNRQRHKSRSRSHSSGRHRSLSGSSSSYTNDYRPRRSRSLSSRPPHNNESQSSPDSHSNHSSEETILWNSDDERNSDSDLDLSKPLDSLTSDVSDSKTLLKHALKCLGSSKVQTMIPLELSQLNRKKLFRMCAELLDETENDQIIKVMEGSISGKVLDAPCSTSSLRSQEYPSKDDSDDASGGGDLVRRKVSKKKRSKKKRKKRKRKTQQETESDEESQESVDTDSTSDGNKSEDKPGAVGPALCTSKTGHGGTSASTTQQSLLELIQIEYKTKAINVMLKNLGVATEISSLVSNVLQTNGISAVQGLIENEDTVETDGKSMQSTEKTDESSESDEQEPPSDTQEQDNEIKDTDCATPLEISNDASENASSPTGNENEIRNTFVGTDEADLKEVTPISSVNADDELSADAELLKGVDDDVLDLEVGANEKLEFLDV